MNDIKSVYEELIQKIDGSKYEKYTSHYCNNLLNIFFLKYEFYNLLNPSGYDKPEELKKTIISLIKELEVILEDEEVLKHLKKNFDKGNYNPKKVLGTIKSINKYIKKSGL